jgi:hypothetical protein
MEKPPTDRALQIRKIEARLEALSAEQALLVKELASLRATVPTGNDLPPLLGISAAARVPESAE